MFDEQCQYFAQAAVEACSCVEAARKIFCRHNYSDEHLFSIDTQLVQPATLVSFTNNRTLLLVLLDFGVCAWMHLFFFGAMVNGE